jgi:hypothetical protein
MPSVKHKTLAAKENVLAMARNDSSLALKLFDAPLPDILAVMAVCNKATVCSYCFC